MDDTADDPPVAYLPPAYQPVPRSDGVTEAERYLQRLCEGSFLRLWSYPGVYRDQGRGKEVADVLVVFGRHIIIFSDKSCAYPSTGDADLDWKRWHRKAVLAAAEQAWGAERWLLEHPDRVFLDRKCTVKFPIAIPAKGEAIVHRVVVAHNVAEPCRREHGGSGSLMLLPALGSDDSVRFAVGDLAPSKGFVHVLDDTSLEVVLGTLDTVADFVEYLGVKEAFVRAGHLMVSPGEEELLALYLKSGDARRHVIPLPKGMDSIGIEEGFWDEFVRSPQRKAQVEANKISYVWDDLIGEFERHFLAGTSEHRTHEDVRDLEPVLRVMAGENRTVRRHLAEQLVDVLHKPLKNAWQPNVRLAAQQAPQAKAKGTLYVFLSVPKRPGVTGERYRKERRRWASDYAMVARYLHPDVEQVLALAMEPLPADGPRSEDVLLLKPELWTAEHEEEARRLHEEGGLLRQVEQSAWKIVEYPMPFGGARPAPNAPPAMAGRDRNQPCPCGSGKKFKRCHGSSRSRS